MPACNYDDTDINHEVLAINKCSITSLDSTNATSISIKDTVEETCQAEGSNSISSENTCTIERTEEKAEMEFFRGKPKTILDPQLLFNSEIEQFSTAYYFIPVTSEEAKDYDNKFEQEENNVTKKEEAEKKKRAFLIVDILISILLIGPSVIGFWRGTWMLMDIHEDLFPYHLSLVLSTILHMVFALSQNRFQMYISRASGSRVKCALGKTVRILYTFVFAVTCNAQWRGLWFIYDKYLYTPQWLLYCSVMMMILVLLRSIRNIIAAPYIVVLDNRDYTFRFPTRFNLNTRDWLLYLLDCAFSVGVVGTLVVFVWRGVWILLDLYLYPGDRERSALGSLAIGYALVVVTFCLQPLMRYFCSRLEGLPRLIVADIFLLLSFLGTVNVWRGIWMALDLWLVPENLELSCWITHIGCFVFLVLLNCSNSVLVRGVYIDAEEEDGKCVVFPCHYLRLFFKIEREKKEARRRNLLVASKDFKPRSEGNGKDAENGALLPNSTNATIIPASPESLT